MRRELEPRCLLWFAVKPYLLTCMFSSLIWFGCAGPGGMGPDPTTGVNPDGTPSWVNRGSGAYESPYGKAFYGVGIAQGIQNPALLRQTSDNRARGEIAKIFDTYIAAMMHDYQRSTSGGIGEAGAVSAEEQDIVSAQKTITEVTVRGIEIRDHWTNPQDGSYFALAVLDLNNISGALDQAQGLNQNIRDYVRDNARRAFEDLDRELQQRSDRSEAAPIPAPSPTAEVVPAPSPADPPPPPPPPPAPAKAKGKIRVGLKITGAKSNIIQTCFAGDLINEGFEIYENTSDVDVMVRGKLTYKKVGAIGISKMINAWVEVRVSNIETAQTSAAVVEKIKVGRPTLQESLQTAITQLCKRVVPKIIPQIRGALKR